MEEAEEDVGTEDVLGVLSFVVVIPPREPSSALCPVPFGRAGQGSLVASFPER